MRQIKFRVWDKKKKVMHYKLNAIHFVHEAIGEVPAGSICVTTDETGPYGSVGKDVVLMQFTGLLDRNGKEIYDGDLLSDGGK